MTSEDRNAAAGLSLYLERYGSPRVQMFAMLMLTAAAGAVFSFLLLRLGLAKMWLRYPAAAFLAYLTFLALLRVWTRRQLRRPDLARELDRKAAAGGGARNPLDVRVWDLFDVLSGIDDVPVALFVAASLAVAGVLAAVVIAAPALLAEVLLDALLVAGLWRRFQRRGATQSMRGSLHATRVPAAIVIASLGVVGFVLERAVPSARSIGDVIRALAV